MAEQELTEGVWTVETLRVYHEALRIAEEKFQAERDRRYAEVNTEREKALQIKEKADEKALDLSAEVQRYKDEKANELREQINRERGMYATKDDLTSAIEKIQAERKTGSLDNRTVLFAAVGFLLVIGQILASAHVL